jgi:hypothetical protein
MKKIFYLWPFLFLALLFSQCEEAEKLLEDEDDPFEQPVYPTACFTAPDNIFVGVAADFSASCSEDAESYSWNFGDGSTASGMEVSHTYQSAGDYQVTLTVVNGDEEDQTYNNLTAVREDVIYVDDNITEDATWSKDIFYVLESSVSVDAILTIEAGTVIKFGEGVNLSCDEGKIIAEGTAELPIIFTSLRHDIQDDTNADGEATTPAAGDWGNISIGGTNNASVFDYCHFYYGGGYYDYDHSLVLESSNTSVTNCTFVNNKGNTLGVLDASAAEDNVTITGNVFYHNVRPLTINGKVDLDDSNIFHNPEETSQVNTENAVFFDGNWGEISGSRLWGETEVPIVVLYEVDIESGNSLTIAPNVVVKMDMETGFNVNEGLLMAQGTATEPIVFTSIHDDTWGGDTDDNADQVGPLAGDWYNISIKGTNNSSRLEYCRFHYGGGYFDYLHTVELESNNTLVDHCTFAYNKGSKDYGALDAKAAESGTQVTNNVFFANEVPLTISGKIDIDDSNIFHNPDNPGETNTRNAIFVTGNWGDVEGDRTWEETEVAFVFPSDSYGLQVDTDNSLTLGDNVVLKFGSGERLEFRDNLYNYNGVGVHFTSIRDDNLKGDSNGDGTNTAAAVGDWNGVYNRNTSVYMAWSNILYSAN